MNVSLDLKLPVPELPESPRTDVVTLEGVSAILRGRTIFSDLSLRVGRQDRLAVRGPNGSGKTTLLSMMLGNLAPAAGRINTDPARIGAIAQGATDWMSRESLLGHLHDAGRSSLDTVAELLVGHRFPLALAGRPLRSLSPGERVRAALIALFHRLPPVELLVLDEPTVGLDHLGLAALRRALQAWPGGLVLVCHDRDFVDAVGVNREVRLGC